MQSQPHARFQRRGHDLVCRERVTLLEALTSCVVAVQLLDGRTRSVACHSIISPQSRKVVEGAGMPIPEAEARAAEAAASGPGVRIGDFNSSSNGSSSGISGNSSSTDGSGGGGGGGGATRLGTTLPRIGSQPRRYGDLVIEFDIVFPTSLSQDQKALLHQALGGRTASAPAAPGALQR